VQLFEVVLPGAFRASTLKQKLDRLPYLRYPFAGKTDDQKLAWIEDSLAVGFPLARGAPWSATAMAGGFRAAEWPEAR